MASNDIASLYISYWSLNDPLCQTQSVAYLRGLSQAGYRSALITFEQPRYRLDRSERKAMKRELATQGIRWYALKYHKRFPLLATAYDCVRGVLTGVWIAFRFRAKVVHSRSSIPAAMALMISAICGLRFLYDSDARLSEEYAENGHWTRDGAAFRLTAWIERVARSKADAVVVLSEPLRDDFAGEFNVSAPIQVIPCCVDVERFRFSDAARSCRRAELNVAEDEKLFVYVGKTGARYLVDEMFEFFKVARTSGPARLLILSGDRPEHFARVAERHGVEGTDYFIRHSPRETVPEWLSACDAGLAFIRRAICERGSSPVKIGEYLAIGLPVVITDGIGSYSDLIVRENLGVVVTDCSVEGYLEAARRLASLWSEGRGLRERCRAIAESQLSLESVGHPRYEAVYASLLAAGGHASSVSTDAIP